MRRISWLSIVAAALLAGALVAAFGTLLAGHSDTVSWGEGLIVVAVVGAGAAILSLRD